MTIDDDDQLLDRLGQAFAADLEHLPTDEEIAAFRAAVVTDAPVAAGGRLIPFERPVRRIARRVALTGAAAVVGLSAATAVGAAANDGVLPEPARVVAHAVGLPVDSVELASAKDALRRLRHADEDHLQNAVEHAQKALAGLSSEDRRDISAQAARDLQAAEDRLSHEGRGGGGSGSDGSSSSPTSVGSSSNEDHGGVSGGSGNSSGDGGGASETQATSNDGSGGGDHGGQGSGDSGTVAPATTIGSGSGQEGHGPGGGDDNQVATTETSKSGGDDHQTVATTTASAPAVAATPSTVKSEDGHGGGGGGGSGSGGSGGSGGH